MSDKFRRDGTPYPEGDEGLFEWAKDMSDLDKRIVQQTQIGPYWVSTVWLGLNHNYRPGGRPLIFETMIFLHDRESGPLRQQDDPLGMVGLEDYMERYSTEFEAIAGHERACALYRQKWDSGDHHLSETEDSTSRRRED